MIDASKRIKAIVTIRQESDLWTTEKSIHIRLGITEEDIKDLQLDDFIREAMVDTQSELDLAEVDYSSWTKLSVVPNIIRKAVTYGAIEILLARKLQSFKNRIIPYAGPVRFEVVERDATKAIQYFHSKWELGVEKYIAASKGGSVLAVSTADEEPIFDMDDLEDKVQLTAEYTSWYIWLLRRS